MQALVLTNPGGSDALALVERPVPEPGPGEVVVRLHAAALNHRDLFLVRGARRLGGGPFVPGSDGAGTVAAVGPGVQDWQVGAPVVVNPALFCGRCRFCLQGEQSLCDRFEILGGPRDGTWAQYVRVPAANVHPKPDHLNDEEAAALPLALGTAWRALITRAALRPGETVLIHGIGGGVALYCLQIAVAMGARAIVTSSSADKLQRALEMGAAAAINYRSEDVAQRVLELTAGLGADVVVDSGGEVTLPISLAAVRRGGRIVNFGATTGAQATLAVRDLFWKQVSLIGSTMMTPAEFAAALAFVAQHRLRPVVSAVLPLAQAGEALAIMEQGRQFGKLVLAVP